MKVKIKRALISVWDKQGVVDFARGLHELGVELLSTGGTSNQLKQAGLPVRDVSEFTGFPEMLDGRVKTLHPKIHAGLLYIRGNPDHELAMREHGLEAIDLVCVNLYPFEETVARPNVTLEEAVENIDIGGPTMIRSAAKNHRYVTVVTDPADYGFVLEEMRRNDGATTEGMRMRLAGKVFARMAEYNAAIAEYLASVAEATETVPRPFIIARSTGKKLRYGENPHQEAFFYPDPVTTEADLAHAEQLHGRGMSYNNYVDGDAALEAVRELADVPAAAVVKHTNPCGYATGETLAAALEAAWAGDPVSAFGSVIAVTRRVDLATARRLEGRFVEALIAPDFDDDALEYLRSKSKNLRLLKLQRALAPVSGGKTFRRISGGILVQDRDGALVQQWSVPTEHVFPDEKRPLADFGLRACKHVKSNAIVVVREYQPGQFSVLGMGAGQPNRVDAVRKLALSKADENIQILYREDAYGKSLREFSNEILHESVLVSDAFFPFPDSIQYAAESGIRYIVQPGGSRRDEEVIAACDKYGVAMAFTGLRHFRH